MRDQSIDCEDMFVCANQKCVNRTKVCDGKNDCLDRSDEKVCTMQNLDYEIRLAGANSSHEGRVEVKSKHDDHIYRFFFILIDSFFFLS